MSILPRPTFFDWFGIPLFFLVIVVSSWSLITGNPFPKFVVIILLVASILGVIIDSRNVWRVYLRKNK